MRTLKRGLKVFLLALLVFLVLAGAYVGNLLTSNAYPRPEANGWARLNDLPRPRGEGGATTVLPGPEGTAPICPTAPCKPQFYVVGGIAGLVGKTVREVDVLDAGNGKWREGPLLPAARHHPAAASIDGAVYVSGGSRKTTNWKPEANLWVLRPGSDAWEPLPDMPEGRMAHAMVASGGRLYVIGGRGRTSHVLIYDRETGWTTGAPMPEQRDHLGAVVVAGKIYAIGGRDGKVLRRVDVYDTATDSWSSGPDLPRATSGMTAELLRDGRIHVIGGENPSTLGGEVIDRHFVLDLGANTWSTGPKPLLAVHGAAADEVAGILLIAGGSRRQGTFSVLAWTGVTQRFDPVQEGTLTPPPTGAPAGVPTGTPAPTGTGTLPG